MCITHGQSLLESSFPFFTDNSKKYILNHFVLYDKGLEVVTSFSGCFYFLPLCFKDIAAS